MIRRLSDEISADVLRWLKVSEQPARPPGSGSDLQVFRASRRHLTYLYLGHGLKQSGAIFGILLWLAAMGKIELPFLKLLDIELPSLQFLDNIEIPFGPLTVNLLQVIFVFEVMAILFLLANLVFNVWWMHLQWRLHWYMVGEEMLRIRAGLWRVREQTFTLAKIQNLTVHQNAVQRLLGIGDLEVHTAGGGGGKSGDKDSDKLHVGWFRGMEDPWRLRDQIRQRLAQRADSGLGDEEQDSLHDADLPEGLPLAAARPPGDSPAAEGRYAPDRPLAPTVAVWEGAVDVDAVDVDAVDVDAVDVDALARAANQLRDEARRLRQELAPSS